jgi:hypothetical protein
MLLMVRLFDVQSFGIVNRYIRKYEALMHEYHVKQIYGVSLKRSSIHSESRRYIVVGA